MRKKLVIAGDFNLNYLSQEKQYFDIIEAETGLKPNITTTTRHISNTCIDNVLTNIEGTHRVSNICIADHQGLISRVKTATPKKEIKKYTYREMSERNWAAFSASIDHLSLRGAGIEEKWNNLCDDINL